MADPESPPTTEPVTPEASVFARLGDALERLRSAAPHVVGALAVTASLAADSARAALPAERMDNTAVPGCQSDITRLDGWGLLHKMSAKLNRARSAAIVTLKLYDVAVFDGGWKRSQLEHDCDEVTKNYVQLQRVERVREHGGYVTRAVGDVLTRRYVTDNEHHRGTYTDPYYATRRATFKLPGHSTAVRQGIRATIVSERKPDFYVPKEEWNSVCADVEPGELKPCDEYPEKEDLPPKKVTKTVWLK